MSKYQLHVSFLLLATFSCIVMASVFQNLWILQHISRGSSFSKRGKPLADKQYKQLCLTQSSFLWTFFLWGRRIKIPNCSHTKRRGLSKLLKSFFQCKTLLKYLMARFNYNRFVWNYCLNLQNNWKIWRLLNNTCTRMGLYPLRNGYS